MKTAEEIANYFTMKRFKTASNPDGHADKEYFDLLTDEIKSYAQQVAEKVRQDCADKIALLETENYNTVEFDKGYCLAITQAKESILETPITLD